MKLNKKILITLITASLMGGCATKSVELSPSSVMQKYQSVKELKVMLGEAEKTGTSYLAPEGYKNAQALYKQAFNSASKQKPDATELADSGLENLRVAMKKADTSRVVLREVLNAREKAIQAGAQKAYAEEFADLEEKLEEASHDIEQGDIAEAKELRAELIREYSDLELSTLKKTTSRQAKAILFSAKQKDADDYAPKTFKLAEEELALANDILNAGRTQTAKAQSHAAKSVYYSKQSLYITEVVNDFDRRDFSEEDIVLWHQQQLEIVNKPFNKSLSLDRASHDVVIDIQSRISEVMQQKADAEKSLNIANNTIAALQGNIASMKQEMKGNTNSLRQKLVDVKKANRDAQARYNRVQAMFNDTEAYVYRQGNNVLLETHAFNFKVGGSEIDSKNYDLLEKIMQAVEIFDDPGVLISGHTDSTGSEGLNLQLSQNRAKTVTSFLKKIGKIKSGRISTKGYGESRPVASNETKEGRARNRRIEVLIINK